MQAERIGLLTTDGDPARIAARRLAVQFSNLTVIVEEPISRFVLLRRRIRRLGVINVAGQLAFMLFQRLQYLLSRNRIAEIMRQFSLEPRWPDTQEVIHVPSVNSPECIAHLQRLKPRAVLVVGTRLIDRKILSAIDAPFINYHAGITPKYRGVHGGYWARAQNDLENCGVTVHIVDEGIDTGTVLFQARVTPTAKDNFSTFPYLQVAAVLPLLEQAARDAIAGTLKPQSGVLPSQLWVHPTLWYYVTNGLRRGAW